MERQKTSFALTPKAKLTLERLKLRLRGAGIARGVASESGIIEGLILKADFETLLGYFEGR